MDTCTSLLKQIYGSDVDWAKLWDKYYPQWHKKSQSLQIQRAQESPVREEGLAMLISYGDSLYSKEGEEVPLAVLHRFLAEVCDRIIKAVHILPYSPYTSDDGFSISDYRKVREDLGDWSDIAKISSEYFLMTDLVLNHCSSQHKWFKDFLEDKEPYNKFFISGDPKADYSSVVRPRPHFVLSEYDTARGKEHIWTTFSRDQVDLNFENPAVLFEMLDTMLEYVIDHKSRFIRLDAIAYMWKELGTPCIHHPKTHLVVKLMRALLEGLAPDTILITETNVPHEENISYFGNQKDEAQMVYQFPLPPLILHSMITETTKHLQNWAASIPQTNEDICYFNFCASHDGIGVTPTHGILNDKERELIIDAVKKRGGLVSYKSTPKGEIPYELNINYLSAVAPQELPNEERAKIFLASQSILLAMPGVPGIYIHSLLGSENWNHGVKETGQNRTINRQRLEYDRIIEDLAQEGSLRQLVFSAYLEMIEARSRSVAFHPAASMEVLETREELFGIIRDANSRGIDEKVLCLVNISSKEVVQAFSEDILPWNEGGFDLIEDDIVFFSHGKDAAGHTTIEITLEPYEIMWLRFGIPVEIEDDLIDDDLEDLYRE